jgi:hypothetical protein
LNVRNNSLNRCFSIVFDTASHQSALLCNSIYTIFFICTTSPPTTSNSISDIPLGYTPSSQSGPSVPFSLNEAPSFPSEPTSSSSQTFSPGSYYPTGPMLSSSTEPIISPFNGNGPSGSQLFRQDQINHTPPHLASPIFLDHLSQPD